MKRRASTQATHVGLRSIQDGVVTLRDGQARAVLAVSSVNFGLIGAGEQEAVVASFAALLNGLTFPVQALVRVLPVDLERYVAELEAVAPQLSQPLAVLARDHALFLRRLTRHRALLERRFYLVVPADGKTTHRGWRRTRAAGAGDDDAVDTLKQLTARCDELARGLSRCGLSAHRLDDVELAQLFHACWSPDQARVQRLRRRLTEYTALVTRSPKAAARRS